MRPHFSLLLLVPIAVLAARRQPAAAAAATRGPCRPTRSRSSETRRSRRPTSRRSWTRRSAATQQQKRPFPKQGTPEYEQMKQQAVQYLVQRSEFEQKADDLGISIDDEQVDKRLEQVKKDYFQGSAAKYQEQLKNQGITEEQVREESEGPAAVRGDLQGRHRRRQGHGRGGQEVLRREPRAVRDGREPRHQAHPDRLRLVGGDDRHEAEELRRRQGRGPGALPSSSRTAPTSPRSRSRTPTTRAPRRKGGKLTVTRGQTVAPFDQTAFQLGKGTISAPAQDRVRLPHHPAALRDPRGRRQLPTRR